MATVDNREDYIDLLRFVSSIMIMLTHLFYIGIPWGTYVFSYAWIYVEFFLILSGYFTTKHFRKSKYISVKIFKEATFYTFKKFSRFLPYSVVIVPCAYIMEWGEDVQKGIMSVATFLKYVFIEMIFLPELFRTPIVSGTLWYLSAMCVIFPLYCCILQFQNDISVCLITFFVGLSYYIVFGVSGLRTFPHDLLRTFAGLCLGTLVYYLAESLKKSRTNINSAIFTIIEIGMYTVTIIIAGLNLKDYINVTLICFFTVAVIAFSERSNTRKIQCRLFRILGKLSLPIFMWQWTVEIFINCMAKEASIFIKVIMYFCGTIILSSLHLLVVEKIKNK